ncbi:hypothetical protein CDAR_607231 [Caerostris darwini]|uniref:Uncharacterized protein n=1 Tax=Caerostris darwini TaxID=1538125 RepID=A0AAV4NI50_9ARAC|nr:hypothetical protein CDAR_607231 [Caerostris darwini]
MGCIGGVFNPNCLPVILRVMQKAGFGKEPSWYQDIVEFLGTNRLTSFQERARDCSNRDAQHYHTSQAHQYRCCCCCRVPNGRRGEGCSFCSDGVPVGRSLTSAP